MLMLFAAAQGCAVILMIYQTIKTALAWHHLEGISGCPSLPYDKYIAGNVALSVPAWDTEVLCTWCFGNCASIKATWCVAIWLLLLWLHSIHFSANAHDYG